MIGALLKRDSFFFATAFAGWVLIIMMLYGNHRYYGAAKPTVADNVSIQAVIGKRDVIAKGLQELRLALTTEKDPAERGHIQQNLGIAFYDMYKLSKRDQLLDSALAYFRRSIENIPGIARFHYNLGRTFSELQRHSEAQIQYEKAIEANPNHVLALHNLGLLTFFEERNADKAEEYLLRVKKINQKLPIYNYVLGEIAISRGDYPTAVKYFELELRNMMQIKPGRKMPASRKTLQYAILRTHRRLATLYSTHVRNEKRARANYMIYLKLESDTAARKQALQEMKKYWGSVMTVPAS